MHWYLAIICHPEYILRKPPPKPPQPQSTVQTRKRKRAEEELGIPPEDISVGASTESTSLPLQVSERSASEAEEGAVEELLGGCTISQEANAPSSPTAHAGSDGVLHDLQWPDSDAMEVDVTESASRSGSKPPDTSMSDLSALSKTTRHSSPMSVSERIDVDMTGDDDLTATTDSKGESSTDLKTVPAARFYRSSDMLSRMDSKPGAEVVLLPLLLAES